MTIAKAERTDLEQILRLQHLAYQSEAILYNDFSIPPLKQTIEEIRQEYAKSIFLKAVNSKGNIIGSVRAHIDNDTAYIGKLIVHPEKRGQGIGTKLLLAIEQECLTARYELFTGDKSIRNLRLYEHLGYVKFKEHIVTDGLTFIYMEKFQDNQVVEVTRNEQKSL